MLFLLLFVALATAGFCGYVIFAPLTWRHLKDRGQESRMVGGPIAPLSFWWILRGAFAPTEDRSLSALARPAQVLGWCLVLGLLGTAAMVVGGALG